MSIGRRAAHTGDASGAAPVGRLLAWSFGALLLVVLVGGVSGIGTVWLTWQQLTALVEHDEPQLDANSEALQALTDAESGERGYLISGDPDALLRFRPGVDRFAATMTGAVAAAEDEELRALLSAQQAAGRRWVEEFADPVVALAATDLGAARTQSSEGRGRRLFEDFREATQEARDELRARVGARKEATRRAVFVSLAGAVTLLVGGIALGTVVGRRTTRAVTRPLGRLKDTLARLRDGELGARVAPDGPAEIRAVARSVNALAEENEAMSATQRRRAAHDRRVRRMTSNLHEHLDVAVVLDRAAEEVGASLSASWAAVVSCPDGAAPAVVAEAGLLPVPSGVDGLLELLGDALAHMTGDAVAPAAAPWALVVRLSPDRQLGLVVVRPQGSEDWEEHDAMSLSSLARVVHVALTNAELYEHQRRVVDRLHQVDDDKNAFVSTVSHELRTPLTSIVGYLEMLGDGDAGQLSAEQTGLFDIVERNSRRLLALIQDLLVLSRIEDGTLHLDRFPLHLGDLATGIGLELAPRFAAADLELDVVVDDDVPMCDGDGGQLERVLLNLLTNAEKFTPPGGRVDVRVTRSDDVVVVTVADTGMGIPLHEQHRLFSRFYRSSVAQERSIQGTGLGLSIARSIVVQHGGDIAVDSCEGHGTTVRVTLPVRTEVAVP